MGRIFGTDGARGVANSELTCELATEIGRAAAAVLARHCHERPKFLIGMDTRISSRMLEAALISGLCSVGADVVSLGVVPTPAVAYLVGAYKADAGVMISASHNTFEYNGIKLFSSSGYKLSDSIEEEIEAIILDGAVAPELKTGKDIGRVYRCDTAVDDYIDHIISTADVRFDSMKIALDCANGSSSVTAEKLFSKLGAECLVINAQPDGININHNCGSTHLSALSKFVVANGCDVGFAFDGDADRCLAIDSDGNEVDGDKLIAVISAEMKRNNTLKNDTAVITVMSNIGFWKFCDKNGIKAVKTAVGDRYVLEEMLKSGYNIGGEQSGHIIFLDYATTGDGQLTAVQTLCTMKKRGESLKKLAEIMTCYPQTLVNIRVTPEGKAALSSDEAVKAAIAEAEEKLCSDGRVLVRVSGTEPLIRVMLEGPEKAIIDRLAGDIAAVIKERLGSDEN